MRPPRGKFSSDLIWNAGAFGLSALIGTTPDGFSNSGFAFQKYRVSYDPRNDTLNIGLITANPRTIG